MKTDGTIVFGIKSSKRPRVVVRVLGQSMQHSSSDELIQVSCAARVYVIPGIYIYIHYTYLTFIYVYVGEGLTSRIISLTGISEDAMEIQASTVFYNVIPVLCYTSLGGGNVIIVWSSYVPGTPQRSLPGTAVYVICVRQ